MKRIIPFLLILLGCLALDAAPVGLEEARMLGQRFVRSNFELTRQSDELTLVYSMPSFYVFNVGETGFVILSANDNYKPLLGYSQEGVFNPDDMAPALEDFLNRVNDYRTTRTDIVASQEIVSDWESLRHKGKMVSRYGGRGDNYLVQTKWNQNYPYNYSCPAASGGPGGHVYAGCVATAGAQVMKYWDHPEHGQGSHTYTPADHPEYGPITVNFGNATYDWENMPNSISTSSTMAQIEAVSTLIFHVGVSVDMNYRPTSSGAVTGELCNTLPAYFFYTNHMAHYYRDNYSREQYIGFIVEMVDMNWPMIHRGNGHAYVVDGYNDAGLIHFNWGWSGSNDGWYDIDGHNYAEGESVICNCVPAEVYNSTPKAPTNLTVTPAEDNELAATITWTNPSQSLINSQLTNIDRIEVMRGYEVIYTEDNVTPGATMSIVDNSIPCFDIFDYRVRAVMNGQPGKSVVQKGVNVGPTCQWKFVVSSSNFQGWNGSYIAVYNARGTETAHLTVTNSTPTMFNVDVPLGMVKMVWVPKEGSSLNYTLSINIKDIDNNSVFNYSGNGNALEAGVLFEGNNGCGNTADCGTPSNLTATQDPDDETTIVLHWDGIEDPGYGYLIYRDSVIVRLVTDGSTEFRDENLPLGGHCYQVATMCEGGMNGLASNMECEPAGACHAPRNLFFEVANNYKCKLTWDRPEPSDGLSGYFIYRKKDGEEFKRIKLVGPNVTSHTDNTLNAEGDYYYKIMAYYQGLDCTSAPAANLFNSNEYFVHFYYSIDGVNETGDNGISIYPNPTSGVLNVEASMMQSVAVYNMLGQQVFEMSVSGDATSINLSGLGSGMFMVMVKTIDGVVTKKISIIE